MDTSFNNTQNLPTAGFDSEAVHSCQSLERRLKTSEARTRCLLAVLPQIVWLEQVNGAIAHLLPEYTPREALPLQSREERKGATKVAC